MRRIVFNQKTGQWERLQNQSTDTAFPNTTGVKHQVRIRQLNRLLSINNSDPINPQKFKNHLKEQLGQRISIEDLSKIKIQLTNSDSFSQERDTLFIPKMIARNITLGTQIGLEAHQEAVNRLNIFISKVVQAYNRSHYRGRNKRMLVSSEHSSVMDNRINKLISDSEHNFINASKKAPKQYISSLSTFLNALADVLTEIEDGSPVDKKLLDNLTLCRKFLQEEHGSESIETLNDFLKINLKHLEQEIDLLTDQDGFVNAQHSSLSRINRDRFELLFEYIYNWTNSKPHNHIMA